MKQTDTLWTSFVGGLFSWLAYLVGGIDNLVVAFTIFATIDYLSGCAAGIYTEGKLSSKKAFRGLLKKGVMIALIIVANQLDIVTGNEGSFMRNAMLMFLIGTEGISIVENAGKLGFEVPSFLTNVLEQIKNKKGEK
jgi:toxin secretion/phage lysis holin